MYDNSILSKNSANSRHGSSTMQHSTSSMSHHPGYRTCNPSRSFRSSSTNATGSHRQSQNPSSWVPDHNHNHHHHHHDSHHTHPHNTNHHLHHQQQHSNYQFRNSDVNGNASNALVTSVTSAAATTGSGSRPGSQSKGGNHHHQHSPTSFVLHKLSSFSKRKSESDRRKVAERELDSLNSKIDKLLSKMGEPEVESHTKLKLEEECVVCLAAPACMQTFPCGHKVVCRKCLIKTIQVAVSQRCLPLRCVICRNRILRLQHTTASSSANATNSYTSQLQQQQKQRQQQQQQITLQDSNAISGNISPPSSSSSPSSSLSTSPPLSYNSPGSPIAPGCAAAGALTLTPIVIHSLTSSSENAYCFPNGANLPGTVDGSYSGYLSSMPSRSPSPSSPLSITLGSPSSRQVGNFGDQPDNCGNLSFVQDMTTADDHWKRISTPSHLTQSSTDMEAFVDSHNDALNIQGNKPGLPSSSQPPSNHLVDQDCISQCGNNTLSSSNIRRSSSSTSSSGGRKFRTSFLGKRESSVKNNSGACNTSSGAGKHGGKSSGKTMFSTKPSGLTNTSPALAFVPRQTIKVHPETIAQPSGFLTSSQPADPSGDSLAVTHPSSSPTRFSKSNISASTFIAKFLPKSSRRRYNCLRHE